MTLADISFYLDKNYRRINNLILVYQSLHPPGNPGRRSVQSLDLLRVTTVMIHATMEDYLRSIQKVLLPNLPSQNLKGIPLYVDENTFSKTTKFEITDLIAHRDLDVSTLINRSVTQYLDRVSYNNTTEISAALAKVNLTVTAEIQAIYPELELMIERRHNIVHQADREWNAGIGYHNAKSISLNQVLKWKNNVDALLTAISKQL